jgi:hypothetical protein
MTSVGQPDIKDRLLKALKPEVRPSKCTVVYNQLPMLPMRRPRPEQGVFYFIADDHALQQLLNVVFGGAGSSNRRPVLDHVVRKNTAGQRGQ